MPRDRFKMSPENDGLSGVSYKHLPPSVLNARRSHSSDRILEIIRDYDLSPMPFIPYALALSLSVAYRKWRFSQTPMFRARGRATFKKILPILRKLGKVWTSARINSDLGDVVMTNLGKAEWNMKHTTHNTKQNTSTANAHQAEAGALYGGWATGTSQGDVATATQPRESLLLHNSVSSISFQPVDRNTFQVACNQRESQAGVVSSSVGKTQAATDQANGDRLRTAIPSPAHTESNKCSSEEAQDSPPRFGSLAGVSSVSTPGTSIIGDNISSNRPDFWTGGPLSDSVSDEDLFHTWDQSLMDNIDWSFGSNLDPGWPLTWTEYSAGGCG
jgi:hypothetical protein